MQAHVSLFLFAGTWWLEEGRRVEWGLDGVVTKKNVIERYVIVTISSCVKWYQRDISGEKKEERRKRTSFN